MGKYSLRSYIIGFALSIILTLAAYILVVNEVLTDNILIGGLVALAIVQLFVQLIFFLHLGEEAKPRWRFLIFLFTSLVVLIVVLGSIWVMSHLDYHHNMMPPSEKDSQIFEEEGIYR